MGKTNLPDVFTGFTAGERYPEKRQEEYAEQTFLFLAEQLRESGETSFRLACEPKKARGIAYRLKVYQKKMGLPWEIHVKEKLGHVYATLADPGTIGERAKGPGPREEEMAEKDPAEEQTPPKERTAEDTERTPAPKRRGGRPKGSKNKPKAPGGTGATEG